MSRMHIRLTELGLTQRLSWEEVADIQADHEADMAAAREQTERDVDFGDWWHGHPMRTARARWIHALLDPRRVA